MTFTYNLGKEGEQLAQEGHYKVAEIVLGMADPSPENLYNRANCLRRLCRYQESWEVAQRAKAIGDRDEIQALLGALALDMNRPEEAMALLDPVKHKLHYWRFSYALACLHAGHWKEGFHHYDARLHNHTQPLPMWEGEDMQGQTLVVCAEQGLGDSIMFSRFRELLPKHQFLTPNVISRILGGQSGNRAFEGWKMVPLMSVPHKLGLTELPPFKPYIRPLERFEIPRLADTRLAVGIVWRSKAGGVLRKKHEIEHGDQKTLPLELMMPLAGVPGVKLYSLQHEGDEEIGKIGAGPILENLAPRIMDFSDLASFIAEMDVIVSCDTGPAHLAAAMGKRTIVMLNAAGSWQYQCGSRTPWYPTMEIVRQKTPGEWKPVIDEVATLISTGSRCRSQG